MRPALCALLLVAAAGCNDGITCDSRTADLGDLCLPSSVAPGIPSVLQVRESCGPGCSGAPSCTALFRNGQVVLDAEQDVCSDSLTTGCLDQGCQQRVISCTLPALPSGDYALVVPGGPSRLLRVAPGGTASCRLPSVDGGVQ